MNTVPEITKYPKFIIDRPEGKDLYEGQSQERIADNIVQFLVENNSTSKRKVIGVEGEWGSGKSNVIEILKGKLKETYYFFVFDAWGHQEDVTRRSILEGLLSKLLEDNILNGKEEKWSEQLNNLLARKIKKQSKSIPKISWAVILSILGILLTPITKAIAEYYLESFKNPSVGNYLSAAVILMATFGPLAIFVLISYLKAKKGEKKKVFNELFYVYKGKEIENTSEETISESEPTVFQFTKFLKDLENDATKSLVIVFDNMDRLPATKVKQVWSSIHTFFASDDNDLETWAIVPFDNGHICNIFVEDNTKGSNLRADSYIHKTFSIVFHVSPPIMSDWKNVFVSKYKEAFGEEPQKDQHIETIFDYHYANDPKIKPRDIICFINDLVALRKIWLDDIPLKYLAIFAIKRTIIMKNPFIQIISKEYLDNTRSIFAFDQQLDTYISALAFNVPIEKADEVLLKRNIENVLRGESDFDLLSKHKSFFFVFNSTFYSYPANDVSHITACLNKLPDELLKHPELSNYWRSLGNIILSINLSTQQLENKHLEAIQTLSRRLSDKNQIEQLLQFLFKGALLMKDGKGEKAFAGNKYYQLISKIEALLKEIWPEKDVTDLLPENLVRPEEFFALVGDCKEKWASYKILCDTQEVNNFLIGLVEPLKLSPFANLLKLIKSKIDLSGFTKHLSKVASELKSGTPDLSNRLSEIFLVGKSISLDGKLPFTVTDTQAVTLLESNPANKFTDLLLCVISAKKNNPNKEMVESGVIQAMLEDVLLKESFIESYSYYSDFDNLISFYLNYPSPLIKSVITDLTSREGKLVVSDLNKLLTNYSDICAKIFDNTPELRAQFVTKLDSCYKGKDISFVSDKSLNYIIPFISDNNSISCSLVNDIISQANEFISTITKEIWITTLNDSKTTKLVELLNKLQATGKYQNGKSPQNLIHASADVIIKICNNEIPVPTNVDFWNSMVNEISKSYPNLYKNVRDSLLNHSHPITNIKELVFFEEGLFKYGHIAENQEMAEETIRRILTPTASNDPAYISILKKHPATIKNIIEKADTAIIDLYNHWQSKCPTIFDDVEFKSVSNALKEKYTLLSPPPKVVIDSARYGADDKFDDVTEKLKKHIENGDYTIMVKNELFDGNDPVPGTVKKLEVEYTINGEPRKITIPENTSGELN